MPRRLVPQSLSTRFAERRHGRVANMRLSALWLTGGLAIAVALPRAARAADVFVRPVRSETLTSDQREEVRSFVKRAVRRTPEHNVVDSENNADFVLVPSVAIKNGSYTVRIENFRDGTLVAKSEEKIRSISNARLPTYAMTKSVLKTGPPNHRSTDLAPSTLASSPGLSNLDQPQIAPFDFASIDETPADRTDVGDEVGRDVAGDGTSDPAGHFADDGIAAPDGAWASGGSESAASTSADRNDETSVLTGGSPGVGHAPNGSASSLDERGGALRTASPLFRRADTDGYFQIGAGPAIINGIGNGTGNGAGPDNVRRDVFHDVLYNVNAAYNAPINSYVTGKAFGDFNFGDATVPSHFVEIGVGGEFYPWRNAILSGLPYLAADIGYAFVQDSIERTENGLAAGAGTGFKFNASDLIMDICLHYSILASPVRNYGASVNPSVLGLRAAVQF